jgi:hypothetical protein
MRLYHLLLMLFVTLGAAHAGELTKEARARAKHHFEEGQKAYQLGDFPRAITEWRTAFDISGEPILLYNLGQAHRLAKDYDQALFFYKQFLASGSGSRSDREVVQQKVVELDALIAAQRKTQQSPPTGTANPKSLATTPEPTPPAPAPAPPAPAPVAPTVRHAPDAKQGRTLIITGATLGAVGVALIGAGVGFALGAKSAGDEVTQPAPMQRFDPATESRGKTFDALAITSFVIGGASAAAGLVTGLLGWRERRQVSVSGMAGPSGGHVSAEVRF